VANFAVEEYNTQPISISYKFQGKETEMKTKELFKVGSSFPSTKSITFDNKLGNMDLMVHYSDSQKEQMVKEGFPTSISQYKIGEGTKKEKTEKAGVTLRVSNNIHNIAALDEVEFFEEWTEYEKIPVKASPTVVPPPPKEEKKESPPKEGEVPAPEGETKPDSPPKEEEKPKEAPKVVQPEQTFETKEKKKKTFSQINFTSQSFALAPAQRKIFLDTEKNFFEEDNDFLDRKSYKNDLESFCYSMRGDLE